jgi:cytochrome oxidase Cu insertion factor (SCO1/SenC/PrrC family)
METKIERELRFLKAYAVIATIVFAVFILTAFTLQKKQKFEEIDVERINVVEKDGKLKLVISNKERFPDLILDGKPTGARVNNPNAGMLFYNEKGDEVGALQFSGNIKDGKTEAYSGLLFDQFNQDQILGLSYYENDGKRFAGLNVWDRPETLSTSDFLKRRDAIRKMPEGAEKTEALKKLREDSFNAQRVFVGKGRNKDAVIYLYDAKGKERIRMSVSAEGTPKLEFLDESGKVIYSLPNPSTEPKK